MVPWLRIILAFLFCIGVAVAAILVLRRKQGMGTISPPWLANWRPPADPNAPPPPALEGRLRLSPASQVVVLAWADARYLVHVSAAGAQLLDRRSTDEAEA